MKRILLHCSIGIVCSSFLFTSSFAAGDTSHHSLRQYKDAGALTSDAKWYIGFGLGIEYPQYKAWMKINNGSGAPAPYNMDTYTTLRNHDGLLTVTLGRRWHRPRQWIPYYSAGLYYQHNFAVNVGNHIIQYSDPTFTNYNYQWKVNSDVFLAAGKLNLFEAYHFSPFLFGGVGFSLNASSGYGEKPLPGVSAPRTEAGFQGNTTTQWAYAVGAGFDFSINQQFLLSLEYQYQNLGNVKLGHGTGSWSGESLNLGTWQSNMALMSLTYLIDA